jgi:hypothetical protein
MKVAKKLRAVDLRCREGRLWLMSCRLSAVVDDLRRLADTVADLVAAIKPNELRKK